VRIVVATWLTLAAPGPAGHATAAILPVVADESSVDDVAPLQKLERRLRQGAAGTTVAVQDADTTRANMAAARGVGIDCRSSDAACLGRLAVLADVERVLVPIARREGALFHVRVVIVDSDGRSSEVSDDVPLEPEPAAREAVRTLLLRALTTEIVRDAGSASAPPQARTAPSATARPPEPAAAAAAGPDEAAPPLVVLGSALAVTGALVGVGGGIGAVAVEASLDRPESYANREPKQRLGAALLAATAVGAAVAVVGAGIAWAATPD
jgi:hypothetical protein